MRASLALPFLALLGLPLVRAAAGEPSAPALESLTYSGDQSALATLDREWREAGRDARKLAALEDRLVELLRRPESTFAARQAASQRLALVLASGPTGAFRPVTARTLATMLGEERDADLARQILELVPGAAAETSLLAALSKAHGRLRLGLLDSLGRRRDPGAVPALATLLNDADLATVKAAAAALGRIGNAPAEAALRGATTVPPAIVGAARLEAAARLPTTEAIPVLRTLEGDTQLPLPVRTGAFRLLLEREPALAAERVREALRGTSPPRRAAALEALADRREPALISAVGSELTTLDPVTAAGAVAALGRAGLGEAVPAVLAATRHPHADVRAEAVSALGSLPGSPAVVDRLLELVPELREARRSLARLKGAEVAASLLEGAARGPEPRRLACLEQLALRRQTEGLALLRQSRADPSAAIRGAAAAALGEIAPPADLALLTDWAAQATDEDEQGRTLRAVVTLLQRHRTESGLAGTFYSRLEAAPPEVARRLLPALVRLGTPEAAAVAGRLAAAPDAALARAAVDTLARWTDATNLPGLANAAENARSPEIKAAAVAAGRQALERDRTAWTPGTTALFCRFMEAGSKEEDLLLLRVLARANDPTALKYAEGLRSDPFLGEEAVHAAEVVQANLAGRPRARASQGSGLGNLFDGKTTTRWTTPALGEEWLELDFRVARPLRELTLDQSGRAAEFPEQYEVYVTNDPGVPGPVVLSGKGQRNRTVLKFPAGTRGRYVIVRNVTARAETPWTVCEVLVD
ncbi:MAG: HEAT repeat domain-containing protein [Opitutaceae bacterium]